MVCGNLVARNCVFGEKAMKPHIGAHAPSTTTAIAIVARDIDIAIRSAKTQDGAGMQICIAIA